MLASHYQGKRVLVTGHTGFKGSWLCEWLLLLGAEVHGYALPPPTQPALFEQLELTGRMRHQIGDVRDVGALRRAVDEIRPDYIFHLAAQPLVRLSYEKPLETYEVNVMGTANLLEALRAANWPCSVVVVTSDKCYENREWVYGYRESDALGGHDPYSSSKAMAELVTAACRSSFFRGHPVRIASARAGNVIGGGDWAADRIVPDCIRALKQKQPVPVRNKRSTRPWQHVLEPLSGYLWLAAQIGVEPASNIKLCSAFNFGPGHEANRTVVELVEEILRHWPGRWEDKSDPNAVHEAQSLQLSSDKAHALLHWSPVWTFSSAVEHTTRWYAAVSAGSGSATRMTADQIQTYSAAAASAGIPWAAPR
jgi:CDP-glucose 4,6-dehydratase